MFLSLLAHKASLKIERSLWTDQNPWTRSSFSDCCLASNPVSVHWICLRAAWYLSGKQNYWIIQIYCINQVCLFYLKILESHWIYDVAFSLSRHILKSKWMLSLLSMKSVLPASCLSDKGQVNISVWSIPTSSKTAVMAFELVYKKWFVI